MKKKLTIILLLCSFCIAICACKMNTIDDVNQNDSTEMHTDAFQNETVKPQEGERPLKNQME